MVRHSRKQGRVQGRYISRLEWLQGRKSGNLGICNMTENKWRIKRQLQRTSPSPEVITVNKNKEIPSGFFIFLIHRMSVLGLRTPATYSGFSRCFKKWWTCVQVALQPQESRHSATHWSIRQTRRSCQTWEKDWFPLPHILWVSYQNIIFCHYI